MGTPLFLGRDLVVRLHREMIDRYGGTPEIRDEGLLDSALSMPMASFGGEYLHADIYQMAAAYLFHIVQNHPFVDGNKRTGASAALYFLMANGIHMEIPEMDYADLVIEVASGRRSKTEVAQFFRSAPQHPFEG